MKPWARDPAFYASVWTFQSDTPAHEGPTHHALVELWTYSFPLSEQAEAKLAGELRTIPPLLAQARENLVGNARELWLSGIDNIRSQAATLQKLAESTPNAGEELKTGSMVKIVSALCCDSQRRHRRPGPFTRTGWRSRRPR